MSKKFLFVINRKAGGGLRADTEKKAEKAAHTLFGSFDAIYPKSKDEAEGEIRDALKKGASHIVVVGGDGSVNTAANGFFENGELVSRDAAMVVANGGGGCDYYASLYGRKERLDLLGLLSSDVIKKVDVGLLSSRNEGFADRYFVNMASVGIAAETVLKREKGGRFLPNALQYVIPALSTLSTYKASDITIEVDGELHKHTAMLVAISKGQYAGGGMRFGLSVTLTDGSFEVTVIEDTGRLYLAINMIKLYSTNYPGVKGIVKYSGKKISITSAPVVGVEADGEFCGMSDVTVELLPKSLNVVIPGF